MLLFGSTLRSYRDLPLRYAEASTLHRDERAGTLHGLLRVQHVTQDDAHIFCTPEQIEDEIFARARLRARTSTTSSASTRASSSRRGPTTSSAPTRSGTSPRRRCAAALERHGIAVHDQRGRRRVLRPEDRPAHDRRARPLVADGDDPARLADAGALRPHLHGRRQRRAHAVRDPPRAARLARALHRHPDRALRRRLPVLARARPDPDPPGRRGPPRRPRTSWRRKLGEYRVEVDERDETVGKRIRDAEVEKIPSRSSTATRSRTSRSPSASGAGSSRPGRWTNLRSHLATL